MSAKCRKMRLKFFAPAIRKILPSRPLGSRYLGLENIESGTGKLLLDTEQEQVDSSVVAFDEKSVLFGKLRPYLAKVAIPDFSGVASTEIMVFEAAAGNDRRFLAYSLLSDEFIKCVSGMTDGAKMPRANPDDVLNMRLYAPPPAIQRRIASYLDEQTANIDRLMEMRRRQIELLKEQRASIIQEAVTRGLNPDAPMKDSGIPWLGEIPAHWEIKRLKFFTEKGLANGLFKKNDQFGSGVRLVNVFDIYRDDFIVDIDKLDRVEVNESEMKQFSVEQGDLFFVRSSLKAEGIARAACMGTVTEPTVFECHLVRTRPRKTVIVPEFLSCYLNAEIVRARLISLSKTTTMTTIEQMKLADIEVPVLSIDEQSEIIEFIHKENVKLDSLQDAYTRQLTILAEYRAALIHECVTGQREVPEKPNLTPPLSLRARENCKEGITDAL